ncbi:MAG: hypothetical protein HGJ94_10355 [Desulfosarcina sp.]|nr:hypothetical protein [Desulfosarcina sp.]
MSDAEKKWKVIDLVVKGLGTALIGGIVGFYGHGIQKEQNLARIRYEEYRDAITNRTERLTTLVEVISKQKDLDVNISMRMFETMFARYFERDDSTNESEKIREQILLLRLIALNFQDVPINLKPLFEELNNHLRLRKNPEDRGFIRNLRSISKEVANRQAFRVTFETGFDTGVIEVKSGDKKELKGIDLSLEIGEIRNESVELTIIKGKRKIGPFSVGYFDLPIIDNILIGDEFRASVMLIDTDEGIAKAKVRMVAFQSDLASDRFDVKEMARNLIRDTSETFLPEQSD